MVSSVSTEFMGLCARRRQTMFCCAVLPPSWACTRGGGHCTTSRAAFHNVLACIARGAWRHLGKFLHFNDMPREPTRNRPMPGAGCADWDNLAEGP